VECYPTKRAAYHKRSGGEGGGSTEITEGGKMLKRSKTSPRCGRGGKLRIRMLLITGGDGRPVEGKIRGKRGLPT